MKSPLCIVCLLASIAASGSSELLAQVTFIDRAFETGTTNPSFGRGAAVVDLDGDGLLDLIAANSDMRNEFFHQLPDHTFQSANGDWGITHDERATFGVLATDFDNDGDADVYFINGGFSGPQANQLLRNDLDLTGLLTDVSDLSGDGAIVSTDFGGTAFDYDLDGDLDIFLTTSRDQDACVMLRNDGDLFFTDVSGNAGLTEPGRYRHCSSGDFDNDGWMDVAVGNNLGPNRLYRNNGDGTFTDVAEAAGVQSPDTNFGLVLEDFDNDGWMDIYVPKYHKQNPTGPSELYRNNGDGTFADVTAGSGMTGQADMGHNTGDLDGDGYPDIYIGTGTPAEAMLDVLFLIAPNGMGGFVATDVSESSGITSNGPTRCHGMAIGDYNQDGFVDVYANNGGLLSQPQTLEENALWQNQGNENQWTALHLRGTVSNRSGVGSRCVAITTAGREIHRCLRVGHGFANTNSCILRFGITPEETIDRIVITWPSRATRTIWNPPMGQVIDVIEVVLPGDLDNDGRVDLADLSLFVAVLVGSDTDPYRVAAADLDGSGAADGNDIQPFVNALLLP